MLDEIIAENAQGVLILTINRAAKRNALTEPMYGALADHIERAQEDEQIRVVLLVAAGDSFTAGNDLSTFAALSSSAAAGGSMPKNVLRFIHLLATARKPLVAGVQGHAVGIGLTLLLHCDWVVVAHDAKLTAPFVSLALVPEAASSLLVVERIGHARAFALFALGDSLSGDAAVVHGIANKAVDKSDVYSEALSAAKRLSMQPQGALLATKRLMKRQATVLAQIEVENEQFERQLMSAEARQLFQSFFHKK